MSNSLLKQLGLRAMQVAKEAEVPEVPVAPAAAVGPDETILAAAEQAHEANRAYCVEQGDNSQLPWAEADQSIRDSAIRGVQAIMDGKVFNSKDSHDRWMEGKIAEGWTLGDVKDEAAKTHPSLVAYDQLPEHERMKDDIFVNTVKTALGMGEKVTEAEVATVAAECMALVHSMETLEAMASTLETAPPEQLNETNAALINTVVQGVVGEDEGERMMPSVESYSLGSKRVLAAYAKEGVMDKIKESAGKLWIKIKELLKKFWIWLTHSKEELAKRVRDAEEALKDAEAAEKQRMKEENYKSFKPTDGKLELRPSPTIVKQVTDSNGFSVAGVKKMTESLLSLKETSEKFIKSTFNVSGFRGLSPFGSQTKNKLGDMKASATVIISDNISESFHAYKHGKGYQLYSNIGGRSFYIASVDAGYLWTAFSSVDNDLPEAITIDKDDCYLFIDLAKKLSYTGDDELQRFLKKMESNIEEIGRKDNLEQDEEGLTFLKTQFRLLNDLIDGVFFQSNRLGNALVSLTERYTYEAYKPRQQAWDDASA